MSTSKKSQKYLVPRLQLGTMLGNLPLPQAHRLPAPALKDDSDSYDSDDSDDSDDGNLTARYIKMERKIKEKAAKAAENANTARKAAAQAATRRFRQKGRRRVTSRVDSDRTAKDMLVMTSRAASSAEAIARELANKAKEIADHNNAVSKAKELMKRLAPKHQEELNRFTQKKPSNWSKFKKRVKQMFSARKSKLRGRNSGGAKKNAKKAKKSGRVLVQVALRRAVQLSRRAL